jgi:hypothetical protein
MAQKALNIYTPAAAAPHIYAEDDAQVNRARLGGESGITDADSRLACTKVNNNTVRLAPGVYSNQGFLVAVDSKSTEDLAVDSGTAGLFRRDLVIADCTRNGGGSTADTHVLRVLKGTPAASDAAAVVPTLANDSLITGGTHRQEALYSILISGTTLSTITRIAPYIGYTYA